MRRSVILQFMLILSVIHMLPACMSTSAKPSGYLSDFTFKKGNKGGVDRIWLANGLEDEQNFRSLMGRYTKVLIDPVQLAPGRSEKMKSYRAYDGVKSDQVRDMANLYHKMLVDVLSPRYQIVTQPGPDVLRISTALTGLEAPSPIMSAVSTFGFSSIALSMAKKAVTGEHTSVGSASMEMKLLDSQSGRPFMAVMDRKAGDKDIEKISDPLRDSKKAFVWWSEWLRAKMDKEYAIALQEERKRQKAKMEAAAQELNRELDN